MESQNYVLTVVEAAAYLRISRPQAYLGIKTGQIPHFRVGKRILVPRAQLEKLIGSSLQPQTVQ